MKGWTGSGGEKPFSGEPFDRELPHFGSMLPVRLGCSVKEMAMFGVLFFGFLFTGIAVALLGHGGFYRKVTGRGAGSNDHEESRGSF